jgi:hypothetical protein
LRHFWEIKRKIKYILNTFVLLTQVGGDNMLAGSSSDQPHRGAPNRKFENIAKALTGLGAAKRAVLPGE